MEHIEPWLRAYELTDLREEIKRFVIPVPPPLEKNDIFWSPALLRCIDCSMEIHPRAGFSVKIISEISNYGPLYIWCCLGCKINHSSDFNGTS